LTVDITPSYPYLSANTLTTIQNEFTQRGIPVRAVFLIRDPIKRVISSQRMKLHKHGKLNAEEEVQALRSLVNKLPERFSIRSDYTHTLNALEEAFGHENCFISFYETLFTKSTYSSLCKFLYINFIAQIGSIRLILIPHQLKSRKISCKSLASGKLQSFRQLKVTFLMAKLRPYGQQPEPGAQARRQFTQH